MPAGFKFQFDSIPADKSLIVVWYKNSSPLAEIGRQVYAGPHNGVPRILTPNITNEAYTFKFYQSTNGTTLETWIRNWDVDGSSLTSTTFEPLFYTVGGAGEHDPASNQNQLIDPALKGLNYLVSTRATGFRKPSEFTKLPDGGFEWNDGENFEPEDTITVLVYATAPQQNTNSGGGYSDINIVSANEVFGIGYYDKTNINGSSATVLTTTFSAFALIPDGTKAKFSAVGQTGNFWTLQFAAGNTVSFAGSLRNKIHLGKDESLELIFKSVSGVMKCFVLNPHTGYKETGQTTMGDRKGINQEYGDGTEKNVADYPRPIEELSAEQKVSYTDWDLFNDVIENSITRRHYYNRGKWAIGSGPDLGKFKLPDVRNGMFKNLANVTGATDTERMSQGAGGYQKNATNVNAIAAGIEILNGSGGDKTNPMDTNGSGLRVCGFSGMDTYSGYIANNKEGLNRIKITGAAETIVNNYGKYPLVNI